MREAEKVEERAGRLLRFATAMERAAYEFELMARAMSQSGSASATANQPEPSEEELAAGDAEFDAMFAALLEAAKPVAARFAVVP